MKSLPLWLVGKTGYSFFDVWSIVHFCFWVFAGSILWSMQTKRPWAMGASILLALAWECFERYAEKRWPALWLNPESPWNSWGSDILMCVAGVLFVWYALDHWRS